MRGKKMTILRLFLFVVLASAPLWGMAEYLNARYDGYFWLNAPAGVLTLTGLVGMFFPTFAALLTRLFTREGFGNSFVSFRLKGKIRYYLAAVLMPVAEAVLGALLMIFVYLKGYSLDTLFADTDWNAILPILLMGVASNIYIFIHAFGEEFGWRGYMMPKLTELMPMPAAILVGGVIWGLWHAPLTIAGHNFGIDYPGYPWKGILCMCVCCVLLNAFLTFLTMRTGSVFPAAVCHSVHNGLGAQALLYYCICEEAAAKAEQATTGKLPWILCAASAITVGTFLLSHRVSHCHIFGNHLSGDTGQEV